MKQAVVVKTQERYRIKGSRRRERQLREKYIGRKAALEQEDSGEKIISDPVGMKRNSAASRLD